MERHRKRKSRLHIRKLSYPRNYTASGEGNMTQTHILAVLRRKDSKEFHHIIEIIERLAYSH